MRQPILRRDYSSRPDLLAGDRVRSGRASNPSSMPTPARIILFHDSALTSTCDVLLSQAVAKPFFESTMLESSDIFGVAESVVYTVAGAAFVAGQSVAQGAESAGMLGALGRVGARLALVGSGGGLGTKPAACDAAATRRR